MKSTIEPAEDTRETALSAEGAGDGAAPTPRQLVKLSVVIDEAGSVTAATVRPYVFTFRGVPTADDLAAAHATIDDDAWTVDAHGDPDWRRSVTLVLAEQIREDLA